MSSSFFDIFYFTLNPCVPGIVFTFLKNGVYLIGFFCLFLKESPDFGKSSNNNTVEKQPESSLGGFCFIFSRF